MASDVAKAMEIPKDLFIVAIPTHDMRAVVQSLIELGVVSQLLQRPIHFVVSEGSNIPRARNTILQRLQHTFPDQDTLSVLWLDSDIEIPPGTAAAISVAVTWAEAQRACVVANYRMTTGHNVLMANRDPNEPAHHVTDDEFQQMPNFAEVGLAGLGEVVAWFAQAPVWDYSLANAAYRKRHAWPGQWYTVPIGYTPSWTRIRRQDPPDRDVLFYGSLTDRRLVALDTLEQHGLAVQTRFGAYGSERDAWIARSRLVLNLHQVEDAPFEAVRVAYLLANRCAVVAEGDPMQDDDARLWAEGMAWTSYDNRLATCQHWLAETSQRQQLADQGYQLIQRRPEARYLESVLNQMATDHVL